jgi:hypothetical protein
MGIAHSSTKQAIGIPTCLQFRYSKRRFRVPKQTRHGLPQAAARTHRYQQVFRTQFITKENTLVHVHL